MTRIINSILSTLIAMALGMVLTGCGEDLAAAGAACRADGDASASAAGLPECDADLECFVSVAGGTNQATEIKSYCAPRCTTDDDCQSTFEGGCCEALGQQTFMACLQAADCEALRGE